MPTGALLEELKEALRNSSGQIGLVFELMEQGVEKDSDLVDRGAVANVGAGSNIRSVIKVVLEDRIPKSPNRAMRAARAIGGLHRDNPELSTEARGYLGDLRARLEAAANDAVAVGQEDAEREKASKELEKDLAKSPGVYVYSLPSFIRIPQKTDPDRFWFKVGKSERAAGVRIGEQMRATGLPEDPIILRVYHHHERTPGELETAFHRLLFAAGHGPSTGRHTGKEWFATNLDFLDAIAATFGCVINSIDNDDE